MGHTGFHMANDQEKKAKYTARYTLTALMVSDAATVYNEALLRNILIGVNVGIPILIIFIVLHEPVNWIIVMILVGLSVGAASLMQNIHQFQLWRLSRKGLYAAPGFPEEELRIEVQVYEDGVDVSGPGSHRGSYKFSDLKKIYADEDILVMPFGSDMVLVPRSAMSNSRYLGLLDFVENKTA